MKSSSQTPWPERSGIIGTDSWSFICVQGCHTCARSRVTQSELPELMARRCVPGRGRLLWHAAVARWARGVSMRVEVATGLMIGIKQVLSPFFDERPDGVAPDLIVLHGISLPP